MSRISKALARFSGARSGATTIEYCLLCVMIAMGLIAAATIWGDKAKIMYENLSTAGWGESGQSQADN